MTYAIRRYGTRVALGGPLDDLAKCGKGIVGTAVGGATDPYLPEVICRIGEIQALTTGRTPLQTLFGKKPTVAVVPCKPAPPGKGGIGLEHAVKPLRAIVYLQRNPIAVWLGITAVLAVPMTLGFILGRKSR